MKGTLFDHYIGLFQEKKSGEGGGEKGGGVVDIESPGVLKEEHVQVPGVDRKSF